MTQLTAELLIHAISGLPKKSYSYINPKTKTLVFVKDVARPEGPITIARYDPAKGETPRHAEEATISSQMLWRLANALQEGVPVNLDRIFGASYNTRSALETLLAHTPQFYFCYPGRIEVVNSSSKIVAGHKHIIWLPDSPHTNGVLHEQQTNQAISELPTNLVVYDALVPSEPPTAEINDIDVQRRHLQIQIALLQIGCQIGYRTWIAHNDKGLKYGDTKVGELPGIVPRLSDEKLLQAYADAQRAAMQIDCIWFKNGKLMPAVMEVEHSTGVDSGLLRMKKLQDVFPPFPTRWVIVAPDEDRQDVLRKANAAQFCSLKAQFFPYSSVEELYSLCQRRKLTPNSITDQFLDCFMEPCLPN